LFGFAPEASFCDPALTIPFDQGLGVESVGFVEDLRFSGLIPKFLVPRYPLDSGENYLMEFAAVFDLFRAFLKTENKQQNVSFFI